MGGHLSAPVIDKVSEDDCVQQRRYGASSMQGWRVAQEDAHNCILEYDKNRDVSFFAVYDGHGGAEVAQYTSSNFPDFIKTMSNFTSGKYDDALIEGFLEFDSKLATESVITKLKEIAGTEEDDDEEDHAEEMDALAKEAEIPIEELMSRYGGPAVNKNLLEQDSKQKMMSPALKAKTDVEKDSLNDVALKLDDGILVNGHSSSGDASNQIETDTKNNNESPSKVEQKNGAALAEDEPDSTSQGTRTRPKRSASGIIKPDSTTPEQEKKGEGSEDLEDNEDGEDDWITDDESGDDDEDEDDEGEEEEDEDDEMHEIMTGGEEPGMDSGCTAVVALVTSDKLIVANAGDSRCVLSRRGKAFDMSFDHKPEDDPERTRINKAGGRVTLDGRVNGGLNLSRALGDHVYKQNKDLSAREQMITALPDIKEIQLEEGDDFIVLACDGIWNSMTSQEVIDFVSKRIDSDMKLSSICEAIFDHCLAPDTTGDGTGCDNMTCIIVALDKYHAGRKRPASSEDDSSPKSKRPKTDDIHNSNSEAKQSS